MRIFAVIAAFALVSVTSAYAGEARSLSLAGVDQKLPGALGKAAEAPKVVEAPKPPDPPRPPDPPKAAEAPPAPPAAPAVETAPAYAPRPAITGASWKKTVPSIWRPWLPPHLRSIPIVFLPIAPNSGFSWNRSA